MPDVVGPGRTALLLLDLHESTIDRHRAFNPELLATAQRCVSAARHAGIRVVFVKADFRSGHPEIPPSNEQLWSQLGHRDPDAPPVRTELHPALAPTADDLVVVKKRVGAFVGSDLDLVLRSLGLERLVVGGIATSGVVLSTVRAAADLDYRLVVLSDLCADPDPEVHRVLLERVFPASARVTDAETWLGDAP